MKSSSTHLHLSRVTGIGENDSNENNETDGNGNGSAARNNAFDNFENVPQRLANVIGSSSKNNNNNLNMNISSNHVNSVQIHPNHHSLIDTSTFSSLNKENLMEEYNDNERRNGGTSSKCLKLLMFQVKPKVQGPDPSCKNDSGIVDKNNKNNLNIGISSNLIYSNGNISLNTNRNKNFDSHSDSISSSGNNTDSNRKFKTADSKDEKKKRRKKFSEKQKTSRLTFSVVEEGSFITNGDSLAQELNSAAECFYSGSKDHPIAVE